MYSLIFARGKAWFLRCTSYSQIPKVVALLVVGGDFLPLQFFLSPKLFEGLLSFSLFFFSLSQKGSPYREHAFFFSKSKRLPSSGTCLFFLSQKASPHRERVFILLSEKGSPRHYEIGRVGARALILLLALCRKPPHFNFQVNRSKPSGVTSQIPLLQNYANEAT